MVIQRILLACSFLLLASATLFFPLYHFKEPSYAGQMFLPATYVSYLWIALFALLLSWLIRSFHLNLHFPRSFIWSFFASSFLHFLLVVCWQMELYMTSTVCVSLLLFFLVKLYGVSHRKRVSSLAKVTFSLYVSWIGMLSFFYLNFLVVYYDWSAFLSQNVWTFVFLVVAALISVTIRFRFDDRLFPLVCAWTMIGIAIYTGLSQMLLFTSTILLSILLISSVFVKPLTEPQQA